MKTKSKFSRGVRPWPSAGLTLAALAIIGAVAMLFLIGQQTADAQPGIPDGYGLSSWYENGQGGKYLLQLRNGRLPPAGASVSGVVLSDTNCEPDAQNLNHCRNGIRLADGTTINVIDNHMMARYRCLQPGETVSLTTFDSGWVVALTAEAGASR